ncbi:hypothetical protein SUSAZ_11085 [Sulfolobus acidocaldarius SUSAZ]|nr:hypothetical protein SUSAZ_11085 [Sulfolobus acidocaldarius SUSAZ]
MNKSLAILTPIVLLSLVLAPIAISAVTINGITFYSPVPNQTYKYGQQLVLSIQSQPNALVTLYVYDPKGNVVYNNVYQTNSSGGLTTTIATFGSTPGFTTVGTYTVSLSVQGTTSESASVNVQYIPLTSTITATVVNQEGSPLAGATVQLYNTTAGSNTLVATQTTNSQGVASFTVLSFPGVTQTFKLVASLQGYATGTASVSITGQQNASVTITLVPAVVTIAPMYVIQNGTVIGSGPSLSNIVTYQGLPAYILAQVSFAGQPVTTASVSAQVYYPTGTQTVTASVISSGKYAGMYNITIMPPTESVQNYVFQLLIVANYTTSSGQTLSTNYLMSVQANQNLQALVNKDISSLVQNITNLENTVSNLQTQISTLNSSLSSLSQRITSLQNTLASLNSTISSLSGTASSLSSQLNALQGKISSLNSSIANLSGQLNSLQNKVNSLTPLVYGGIIAGIIGLIVAIVAIVLVYRKIS